MLKSRGNLDSVEQLTRGRIKQARVPLQSLHRSKDPILKAPTEIQVGLPEQWCKAHTISQDDCLPAEYIEESFSRLLLLYD
jgi:hypothetical protein